MTATFTAKAVTGATYSVELRRWHAGSRRGTPSHTYHRRRALQRDRDTSAVRSASDPPDTTDHRCSLPLTCPAPSDGRPRGRAAHRPSAGDRPRRRARSPTTTASQVPVNAPATTDRRPGQDVGDPPLTIASATDPAERHGRGRRRRLVPHLSARHRLPRDGYVRLHDHRRRHDGRRHRDGRRRSARRSPSTIREPLASRGAGRVHQSRRTTSIRHRRVATSFGSGHCGLLHNDTDPDGDPLTWQILTQPAHGTVLKVDEEFFALQAGSRLQRHGPRPAGDRTSTRSRTRRVDDVACSPPATMKIWVAPINDAPTFTPGAATVTVGEDSGPYSAPWATNVSPGPASESWQVVHFETDTDLNGVPNLFTVPPSIDATGKLTFTPRPTRAVSSPSPCVPRTTAGWRIGTPRARRSRMTRATTSRSRSR